MTIGPQFGARPFSLKERVMKNRYFAAIVISLAAVSSANAQVKRGVMTVTGAEMH